MKLARVIGNVVSTSKDERLIGTKLLIVRLLNSQDIGFSGKSCEDDDSLMVSVDMVGAGVGELVLICSGSSASRATGKADAPIDSAIVGIVDSMDVDLNEA